MKKKLFILIPMLLLASCGGDAQQCDDSVADFPDINFTYSKKNPSIKNSYKYELDNPIYNHEFDSSNDKKQLFEESDKSVIPDFDYIKGTELAHGYDNILSYAQNTSLQKDAELPTSTRYPKIFDGQVSCAGPVSNSRIGIYSDGIILELNRTLENASGITFYMTHNYLTLKMRAIFTLYKPTGTLPLQYDEYQFSFYTNLGTSVAGPKFFYLDLTKILENTSILKGCNMLGLRYERIDLTEEEKQNPQISNSFAKYYDNIDDEKNHDDSLGKTFVKLYDIGMPYSKWSR
ncbi:MAG: hypothetical protein J1F32_02740 [Erysipelotrichales bacterium]|nr:hypothetical protein [Erysipelotrichales bacterium]